MIKHTPGPWIAGVDQHCSKRPCEHYDTDDVYTATGLPICRMNGNVMRSYHDARLIAAAPAMLEALQECASDPNCYAFASDDFYKAKQRILAINNIVKAAIALATDSPD